MKKITKFLIVASFVLNICFVISAGYFVYHKGGLEYLESKTRVLISKTEDGDNTDGLKALEITKSMVSGMPHYSGNSVFYRLPNHMKQSIRPVLWELSKHPSGVRLRFRTNSNVVKVNAYSHNPATPHHMNSIMKNGVDIYVNNLYSGSAWPNKKGEIQKLFTLKEDGFKNVTIYLPLFEEITIESINVQENAKVLEPDDLNKIKPIIYYGSSITQGGVASNPGMSYQAIISRSTKIDFVNLGFSGNGTGDAELAKHISTLESSLIVLDYWANPSPEVYKNTLPEFVNLIREKHKTTPIIVISPFYSINRDEMQKEKKKIAYDFVAKQKENGDQNIYFFDGNKMISKQTAFGLADGRHLNSLGFWLSANALEPMIKELTGLK